MSLHHLRIVISVVLSYLLVILLCIPFSSPMKAAFFESPASSSSQAENIPHREGELIVRFRGGISQRDKDTILATHGVKQIKRLRGASGFEKLELSWGRDSKTVALELLMNPQVEFAEPNFLISKDDLSPDDPQFKEQWALRNTGQSGGHYGADIKANGAWQTTTGSADTVIAVIDGVNIATFSRNEPFVYDMNGQGSFFAENRKTGRLYAITTDFTSKTRANLGGAVGGTYENQPRHNYVASDFASDSKTPGVAIMAAQIHEIGNSLKILTGRTPRVRNPNVRRVDRDAGMALEECVFGGYVRPDGTVLR